MIWTDAYYSSALATPYLISQKPKFRRRAFLLRKGFYGVTTGKSCTLPWISKREAKTQPSSILSHEPSAFRPVATRLTKGGKLATIAAFVLGPLRIFTF